MCKAMQKGIDLIIPVLMPSSNGNYLLNEDRVTYVLIQIRNRKTHASDDANIKVAAKMTPEYVGLEPSGLDYVCVIMNVGEDATSCSTIETTTPGQICIVLNGIDQELYPCLEDAVELAPEDRHLIDDCNFGEIDSDDSLMDIDPESYKPTTPPSYLTKIVRKLLGRSFYPDSFYQKNSVDYENIHAICKPFFREQ